MPHRKVNVQSPIKSTLLQIKMFQIKHNSQVKFAIHQGDIGRLLHQKNEQRVF